MVRCPLRSRPHWHLNLKFSIQYWKKTTIPTKFTVRVCGVAKRSSKLVHKTFVKKLVSLFRQLKDTELTKFWTIHTKEGIPKNTPKRPFVTIGGAKSGSVSEWQTFDETCTKS